MAKYNSGNIYRLDQSLVKNAIDANIRKKIMKSGEFIQGTSKPEALAEWCFKAMIKMDELLDESIKQRIREDCACCLGGKREKLCKSVNRDFTTPEERINAINETHYVFGHEIRITGKGKYEVIFYDEETIEKKCSCYGRRLNVLNKKWSKTWCYCCGGHIKHHLETVLGKKVKVKLISSVLSSMGNKNCHFELKEL
jgi:hypothetical protein